MKKITLPFLAVVLSCTTINLSVRAQQTSTDSLTILARQLGIQPVDIPGFIRLHSTENHTTENNLREPENFAPLNIVNPGFETGDFTGWSGYIGDNNISSNGPLQSIQPGFFSTTMNASISDLNARHTIMNTAASADPCLPQSIVPAGFGNYVVRMGNTYATYQGEQMSQLWNVSNSNTNLYLGYSIILNDGGHLQGEQPYFYYLVTDSTTSDTIAFYYSSVGVADTSFHTCAADPSTSYRLWHIDTIDLSAYINQTVRLEFIVAGCIYGGHYGYCYIDADPYDLYSVGINEETNSSFSVYPNPSNGIFNLNFQSAENKNILVCDITGRTILSQNGVTGTNAQLDLSSQATGLYFVTVQSSEGTYTRRIQTH